MRKLSLIALILVVSYSAAAVAHADTPRLRVPGDSITIVASGERSTYPLSALKQNDTIRVWDITSLQFISTVDSILIEKTDEYVPIDFELPDSLLHLLVWFADSGDRYRGMIGVLQAFPDFGTSPTGAFPDFSYAAPDDPDLVRVRETYRLDSVAGDGSEVDRAINLMRWVHTAVRHDGSSQNPSPRNSLNLLKVCADSGRGLNCRMMATILNEAYLAMGYKSRHLTCLPQDSTDPDCHVVNMVWSDSLGKWLYMDPTNNAYFMNTSGAILSPAEIRTAMIGGDSLVVNGDADYNGAPLDPIQYKGYMAKNLFRFSTPMRSAFNYESLDGDRGWISLEPAGWHLDLIGTVDTVAGKSGATINVYTDNAAWFWEE